MLSKRKILIVEDEFILADKIEEVLKLNGFIVLPVTDNYDDAVSIIKKELPDIALLDINIKGNKDGIELAGYIYGHFNIPVIFLSALTDHETVRRAKAAHPNTFIIKSKPFLQPEELIEAIRQQLLVSINVALPEFSERNKLKSLGLFCKAKEIDLSKRRVNKEEKNTDTLDKELLIKYNEITFIESNNSYENNTVLIHSAQSATGFVLRKTMKEIEDELPEHFARIHDSFIINLQKVTARRTPHRLFINDHHFNIGDKYRDNALEKINLILGH